MKNRNIILLIVSLYDLNKEQRKLLVHKINDEINSDNEDEKVRQTVINAAGETGIIDFHEIERLMENGTV
jgi:hypothetical protein